MDEYVEKRKVLEQLEDIEYREPSYHHAGEMIKVVRDMPAADVAPVVHATWQATEAYPHNVYCTHCYKIYAQTHWTVWEDGSLPRDFCPACGARMDGVSNA